ncbi:MAG: PIN domain-containing protein [Coriobacteriia bacterium]|nr:PIN domain-containing protein [Coriobacteriia bacterium]
MIDTNVIMDVLAKREPHFQASYDFLRLCDRQISGCLTVSQTTDLFYLLTHEGKSSANAKALIREVTHHIKMLEVSPIDVEAALASEMQDFEDALLACVAYRKHLDFVITRNEKDFQKSPVPAISPAHYLKTESSDRG